MKTIVKLLIAAAILHACFRGAQTAWAHFQFKDATQQVILFGAGATTAQLHEQIVRRAAEYELPVDFQNVVVTRDGVRTLAEVKYSVPVELVPRFTYPVNLSFSVDAMAVKPQSAESPTF